MASSGTILPSISTFANYKEKFWEDRCKLDLGSLAPGMMDSDGLGRKDVEDLEFLDLEFILANTIASDGGSSVVHGVDESFRLHQEDPCGATSMLYHHHHHHQHPPPLRLLRGARHEQPPSALQQPDGRAPPLGLGGHGLLWQREHSRRAQLQGRFVQVSTSDLLFAEEPPAPLPCIKVEPASPSHSPSSYGPVLGMAPLNCVKIKHEGSSSSGSGGSCMLSFESSQSPQAAAQQQGGGSMTPPLSPEDLLSSEGHQQHMCRSASLIGFPQGFHPHHRTPTTTGGYPGLQQLPFHPHHHHHNHQHQHHPQQHHHQFSGMYHGEDASLGMGQQQGPGSSSQRVLLTPPSSPLEVMDSKPKRGRRSWPRKRTATHTCTYAGCGKDLHEELAPQGAPQDAYR
ncbi:hypothetical protein NHX12_033778 [Muraenolepis orangiensis]|uniref:Uncharacterized protein n=1 Tax=Muraenolepis orangiensis TaxID=630683 RepID=A0A9Q0E2D8_9TELE|nr:hypothetical protein NHX12_033778 [Muraenolepis orangiensis]